MDTILAELSGLFAKLPTDTLSNAVQVLCKHDRIFVYAAGRSGLMLRAFAMRLTQIGKTVYVVGETVTPALEQGDLLVLASASGATQSVCHYAQLANTIGADLLVVSATVNTPLSQIHAVDILLPASSKNTATGSVQIMGSLFEQALLLFCDGIIAAYPCDRTQMQRRHANLE